MEVAGTLIIAGGAALLGSGIAWACAREKRQEEQTLRSAVQMSTIERVRSHPKALSRPVAIRGRVRAEKPFTAELSGLGVAVLRTVEELVTEKRQAPQQEGGEPQWVRSSSVLANVTKTTEWSLADGSGAEMPIELPFSGRSLLSSVMQHGGDRLVHAREKGRDRVAEEQLGDRTVGVHKTEEILPVGTVLTAMGNVYSAVDHPDAFEDAIRSPSGRMLVLRPTLLSRKTLGTLIDEAEQEAKELESAAHAGLWIGGGLVVGGLVVGAVSAAARRRGDGRR